MNEASQVLIGDTLYKRVSFVIRPGEFLVTEEPFPKLIGLQNRYYRAIFGGEVPMEALEQIGITAASRRVSKYGVTTFWTPPSKWAN